MENEAHQIQDRGQMNTSSESENAKAAFYSEDQLRTKIKQAVDLVRANNPLAGSVTNGVTMDFVANAQLAVGGSAAMVYLPDEAEGLALMGGAMYANMGTLMPIYEETMPALAKACFEAGKPWVLDPVGIGLGALREQILKAVALYKPAIIRGNASEIIALANLWGIEAATIAGANQDATPQEGPRGVDSVHGVASAVPFAVALARYTGGAVAVSGEEDLVTNGYMLAYSKGGSALMSKITGFGCSLGGVAAIYATQVPAFIAALAATAHYNCAGVKADLQSSAPGSFKVAFIDALYQATSEEIAQTPLRVKEI